MSACPNLQRACIPQLATHARWGVSRQTLFESGDLQLQHRGELHDTLCRQRAGTPKQDIVHLPETILFPRTLRGRRRANGQRVKLFKWHVMEIVTDEARLD